MKNDKYTRRRFLELGSGAVAGAGVLSLKNQGQNQSQAAGYVDQAQKAKSDPGPANKMLINVSKKAAGLVKSPSASLPSQNPSLA